MTITSTSDLETARKWANELLGDHNPTAFFLSPLRFEVCGRTADSLSLTLSGKQSYGLGFGPRPPLNADWASCSIDDSQFGKQLGELVAGDQWDFYSLDTTFCEVVPSLIEVSDDNVIAEILTRDAPQSQVWPGNPELVNWFGVNNPHGALASLAALVRWESGLHVLSSVVTVSDLRGKGYALTLVRGVGGELQRRGLRWLGLGVAHENVAAQRVYEHAGFVRRAQFTTYSSPPMD